MKRKVKTRSGAEYVIDFRASTFTQTGSTGCRTRSGTFTRCSTLQLGSPLIITAPPLEEGDVRVIRTTPITSISEA